MELTEQQQGKLLAYFENQLSPQDELAFLEEVAHNEVLKEEFNREMLWRTALEADPSYETAAGFEPADTHLTFAARTIAAQQTGTALPKRRKKWPLTIAAVLLTFLTVAFFYNKFRTTAGMPAMHMEGIAQLGKYTAYRQQVAKGIIVPSVNTVKTSDAQQARVLFRQLFKRYRRQTDDPVQVDKYLIAYTQKKYATVLSSKPEDYLTKGADSDSLFLEQYMDFYRGLCLLETGKSDRAVIHFQKVAAGAKSGSELQQSARQYLKLAHLQAGRLQQGQ